ncbi:immunoglobulin-like domain-containing protein [Xylocopilactobacillus apis]|uniref:Pesticidal crystal protein Cry22Aa Ig-like domain-containing protein n=1 Tax=Xylocopilactobacillus apis TaxID=2932183 RepID=A0AAU9D2X2_9LACO|nr:immunoglobulin-like domain-containing protein [Xylocopilactobacillus apis]BDR56846.1 hypothetical protein KIMC2_14080 [Xylocopilactobacillus apis]
MKFKLTGLAGTALLLLSPVASAMSAVTQAVPVQADNTWDYDVDEPGLGDYDQLLQNAGPSDGIVDWYPTKDAMSENPTGQKLLKQLIDLSIATNDKDSDARKILFNDTTGNNANASYKDTYNKYSVALGFIAQILNFNNSKSGVGARLEQSAVAGNFDPEDSEGQNVIRGKVLDDPSNKSLGHNISDVLGTAFFGNADDAYAQIYVNGYDNVAQNEANIIREATSSITIVAQSKTTGKKATAIFKLNNKTLPKGSDNSKLNNYIDGSVYALDNKNGNGDIAGLNMTTASRNSISGIKFSRDSTFWIDGKNGDGTIVVPRGTTAKEIAELISRKKITSNNSLRESAPMKAIQNADGTPISSDGKKHAYNHFYEQEELRGSNGFHFSGEFVANGSTNLNNIDFNYANRIRYGINGPIQSTALTAGKQYREYNNVFNSDQGAVSTAGGFRHFTGDERSANGWFGGTASGAGHMLDTNEMYAGGWNNKSAHEIPNVEKSEGDPYSNTKTDDSVDPATHMIVKGTDNQHVAVIDGENPEKKYTNIGKVKHLFQPSSYFKEAYDANHFVTNSPSITDTNVDDIAKKIADNGSFNINDPSGVVKKSFTYEVPVSSWIYKSYNNPYSTIMSSAGAQTIDGQELLTNRENSNLQPQEKLDLKDPNNDNPSDSQTTLSLGNGNNNGIVINTGKVPDIKHPTDRSKDVDSYFYSGVFSSLVPGNGELKFRVNGGDFKIVAGTEGTLVKYGTVGTDGENNVPGNNEVQSISYKGANLMQPTTPQLSVDVNNPTVLKTPQRNEAKLITGNLNEDITKNIQLRDEAEYFVQVWDKNTTIKEKDSSGNYVYTDKPKSLIYNSSVTGASSGLFDVKTLGKVDSPNFESKYYLAGVVQLDSSGNLKYFTLNDHLVQSNASKRAYFNSNLYNNPDGPFAGKFVSGRPTSVKKPNTNNSRFFVSQDFSVGPVSSDMINDPGVKGSGITIDGKYYPYGKSDSTIDQTSEQNAADILKLTVMYNDPTLNTDNNSIADSADPLKKEFTDEGGDGNGFGTDGSGYKLVTIADTAKKQGVSEDELAGEVAKVTGKSTNEVKRTKWVQATLPRLKENAGTARINVVIYDKAAVSAPTKQDTKPSFSTTDISGGNDPFNVNFRPYTTTYDDGAVLKAADVPQNFKNLLSKTLVAGNPDLVGSTAKLQQILVSTFLDSWQQNDGSFKQTDTGAGVNSPLYLYGGFGISNSDTKNSYAQWPKGYTDNSGEYNTAITNHQGDFYRGGVNLKEADNKGTITGIPFTALTADVSKLDITKAGTYPVVYTYTNPSNSKDTASITVPVTVSDSSAPVFSFQGTTNTTIHTGDKFDINNYKVVGSWSIFNNYGGDYNKLPNFEGIAKNADGTPKVTVTGTVDTHKPGIYQLTYKATSVSGAVTEMVRNITVLPTNGSITTPSTDDWNINAYKAVGYINYVPGYGIMVYNAPAGSGTGQRLAHGTAWKISQRAVNAKGETFYRVGDNQWINGKYVSFSPINTVTPLKGEVMIVYKKGYGVNLWKSASTTNGYYPGRKLMHGSRWKVSGKQNGFYNVGKDQWIQGDYAGFRSY